MSSLDKVSPMNILLHFCYSKSHVSHDFNSNAVSPLIFISFLILANVVFFCGLPILSSINVSVTW